MPTILPDAGDNRSLLDMCQNAAVACVFPSPASIIGNSDQTAQQLLVLAGREGAQLSRAKNWSRLIKEHTFTLATGDQDYALPDDFRWIIPQTTYDRDNDRIVLNPINSQEWQYLKAWSTIAGLTRRARIRAGRLEFEQTITAADNGKTIAFEYLSSYWIDVAAGGSPKASFTLDSDITLVDSDILVLGLVWRFRRAKGLEYETEMQEYISMLNTVKATDGGARTLNMGSSSVISRLSNPNVTDSGYEGI